jgi:hypothetical protein
MTDETASAEGEPNAFYTDVASRLNHEVGIGGALITMVEPHLGHEKGYNRWYEDDHFYAGAMCMPWMFAGRRFVATRDLQLLRYPEDSFIAQPVTAGCYIHLYWITVGHVADHEAWTRATNMQLTALNRRFEERTHIFTAFQDFAGATYRDAQGPLDIHSLDYPYDGMVLEVIDAHEGTSRDDLDAWLRDDYLPGVQASAGSPVAQSLRFTGRHLGGGASGGRTGTAATPEAAPQVMAPQRGFAIPGAERRITVLHFLDRDPRVDWDRQFGPNGDKVATGGLGRLELCAPFIPVLHGTDRYVDQLR